MSNDQILQELSLVIQARAEAYDAHGPDSEQFRALDNTVARLKEDRIGHADVTHASQCDSVKDVTTL